jgi:eukaryotic-like serine/threonine-protein kinase
MRRCFLPLLVCSVLAGVSLRTSANEPASVVMFRGDAAHSGVYTSTGGGGNLAGMQWRFPTGGEVNGSPVITGNTVYAGSGDGKLYAIDLERGTERWSFDAGSPIASSPAVADGVVFLATGDGTLMAIRSGKAKWRMTTGTAVPWPWGHESGDYYISSPVIAGERVIFGAGDGNVYALDRSTGVVRWKAPTGERIRATPAVSGKGVFVGTAGGKLYRFELATGKQQWVYATAGASLASGEFGYDRRTLQSSPAVANGVVYVGARDGQFYAVDVESGTLRWKSDYGLPWVISSPAVDGTHVYLASSDGHFVQALDAATGKEIWKTDYGTPVWSSPAVTDQVIYAGDFAGRLNALDRATGAKLWSFRTKSMVLSSPVVVRDLVVFGSSDGAVYALRTSAAPVKRIVYVPDATSDEDAATMVAFFVHRDYVATETDAVLARFLTDRIADRAPSIVVFVRGRMPDEAQKVVHDYLVAGGKIVWCGAPAGLVPNDPEAMKKLGPKALDWSAPARLVGVDHSITAFDDRGTTATAAGRRWGLGTHWRSAWGVPLGEVSEALSSDEWGLTTDYVKSFGGEPGTGFVRGPISDNDALYFAAEYRPRITSSAARRDRDPRTDAPPRSTTSKSP